MKCIYFILITLILTFRSIAQPNL
ncbi:hypothetical protein MNBD_IGNAVI01-2311, partial [hydrothermal vent metagenome]